MSKLNLSTNEKQSIQSFTEELQKVKKNEFDRFASKYASDTPSAWHHFIKAAYTQPITWWIGIFHLQMQSGLWGHKYQSISRLRASKLWKLSTPLREDPSSVLNDKNRDMLLEIVKYNWSNRKADISGRFLGGMFTNYTVMGGRLRKAPLPKKLKYPIKATNAILASYGAAIKAMTEGHESIEPIIQSILTGNAEHLPDNYDSNESTPPSKQEVEISDNLNVALTGIMTLTQVEAGPVPIKEFCSRPENINIKGLCR